MRGVSVKDVNVAEGIVPLGDFKAKAAQYLKQLGSSDEPIVITQNGRPVAVLLSPASFEGIRERQEFLEAVAAGAADMDAGRTVDHNSVKEWLESWGTANERTRPR